MRVHKITDCIFMHNIVLVTDCECGELCALINKKYDHCQATETASDGLAMEIPDTRDLYLWLRNYTGTPEDVALLAHEVLHLTFYALRGSGVIPCSESEEAFTYWHEWLLYTCMKKLNKKRG